MEKKLKVLQKINYLTVAVAFASVILPIIFWKKIPDRIPQHYGSAGVADAWSDKSTLILLFVVILFLLGMMSVVTYYIRSGGMSPNASESEKKNLTTLYPMMVILNLFLQLVFAYMVFCSATAKEELGRWFLPVVLIGTFAPVVRYIYKEMKTTTAAKEMKRVYAKREKEEEADAVSYRTRVDLWLAVLMLVPVVTVIKRIVEQFLKGETEWFLIGTVIFILVLFVPLMFIRYTLYSDYILVQCHLFGKERIPYEGITKIKKTYNPLSSAALSLRRVQIDYTVNGSHKMILISPVRREEFIKEVEKRRGLYYNKTHHE